MDCFGLSQGREERHENRKLEIGLPTNFEHRLRVRDFTGDFAAGRIDLGLVENINRGALPFPYQAITESSNTPLMDCKPLEEMKKKKGTKVVDKSAATGASSQNNSEEARV